MQVAMIGVGRMGDSMVRRLLAKGHECIVHCRQPAAIAALQNDGAIGAATLKDMVTRIAQSRLVWLMVPAAAVDHVLGDLVPLLDKGDIVVDGGNSYYRDDIDRSSELQAAGIHYLDVGTSGGVKGFDRGYCLMVGGEPNIVAHVCPIFVSLAPGITAVPRTPGRTLDMGNAELGFLHCGPCGAGHFVKMVHNGIEYGVMAAYAEGFNILRNANVGKQKTEHDAETTPLSHPEFYQFDMGLLEIAEMWWRGSVIGSWLLDLSAQALQKDPELAAYGGRVSDSGEGRWTIQAAIDEGVPAHVLSAALFDRFSSRGNADFANRVLSAMRHEFGGYNEKPAP